MKKRWMLLVAIIAAFSVMFFAGCKDDPTDVSEFETLIAYMDGSGMTVDDLLAGWIIAPDSLVQVMADYYIMDIRAGDYHGATAADAPDDIIDYDNGHIEGAVLSSFGNIVTDAADADNPIVVVCYTGQSAGHAVMALRLSGYTDAKVLKWGMSGWNGDFDKWTGSCDQKDHANWVVAPGDIVATEVFDYPEIDTGEEDGADILEARIAYMLEEGFKGIAAVNDDGNGVLDTPDAYFINNFWAADDVTTYGNIIGAYRINPLVLENLNPDGIVVTYCWTGQTSSMLTAYLTVLGYEAKSLKNGANSMIYDDLTGHKWIESFDYDYIVTP